MNIVVIIINIILFVFIQNVNSAYLRHSNSPLNQYFKRDKKGLNIFDYNAEGIVPDKITDLAMPLKADPANAADPKMGTTRDALFRTEKEKKRQMEEWLGGRKVINDCPTFPFCNHVPAPPPVLPGPDNLEQLNPHIVFPWSKARDPLHALLAHKPDKYNKWHGVQNKKWGTQDINFHEPYTKESPSKDPAYIKFHETFMRHIYSPAIGHIGAPGGLNGADTLAKSSEDMAKAGLDKIFNDPKLARYGAGMRIDSDPNAVGYQPPGKPNRSWEAPSGGKDIIKENGLEVDSGGDKPGSKPNPSTDGKAKTPDAV